MDAAEGELKKHVHQQPQTAPTQLLASNSRLNECLSVRPETCLREGEQIFNVLIADKGTREAFAHRDAIDAVRMRQVCTTELSFTELYL